MEHRTRLAIAAVAAIGTVLAAVCAGMGGAGALITMFVDVPEALTRAGIHVDPGSGAVILNWAGAALLIAINWIFAVALMYYQDLLPWQKPPVPANSAELDQLRHSRDRAEAELQALKSSGLTFERHHELQRELEKAREAQRDLERRLEQAEKKPQRLPPSQRPSAQDYVDGLADRPGVSTAAGDERRLEIARSKLNERAKAGKGLELGTVMNTWMSATDRLVDDILRSTVAHEFPKRRSSSGDKALTNDDRKHLELAIVWLEGMQVRLKLEDLKP